MSVEEARMPTLSFEEIPGGLEVVGPGQVMTEVMFIILFFQLPISLTFPTETRFNSTYPEKTWRRAAMSGVKEF